MINRRVGSMTVMVAAAAVLALAPIPAAGQPSPGQPALATTERWNPPRTPDGHPDMQGYWDGGPVNASHSIEDGCCDPIHARMQGRGPERLGLPEPLIVDPPDGRIPYQPWAAAKRMEHLVNMETPTELEHIEPEDRCLLLGTPRSNYRGDLQIRQASGQVVILYEWVHAYRVIPTDGRPHVGEDIHMYNGDSRGRWEGDTLVVDVTNFDDHVWFDSHGSFYSEALHVVERWTLIDPDTINYEATIEDPTVFTRPWKMTFNIPRITQAGYEFFEEACYEGNSTEHRLAAGRLAVAAGEKRIHTHEDPK